MSVLSHNIYENVRTRVIVLHAGQMLLQPPSKADSGWLPPGGGLEPNESLAECAAREVLEETGIEVQVTGVAFLRQWVVPKYCALPGAGEGVGFGLEVYFYASPVDENPQPRPETARDLCFRWVPLAELPALPLWPKELKALAAALLAGRQPQGVPAFVSQLESPWAQPEQLEFV